MCDVSGTGAAAAAGEIRRICEEAMAGPPSMAGGGPGGFGGHSAPGQGGFGGAPRQGENVVLIPCAGVESRIIGKSGSNIRALEVGTHG